MNTILRRFGWMLALWFVAFGAPAWAQKTFTLEGFEDFATLTASASGVVAVVNNSPDGNSNYNSFRLIAPAGVKIESALKANGNTYSANVGQPAVLNGRWTVTVTNISPSVAKFAKFTLDMTISGGGACTGGSSEWNVLVRGGSQINGQAFNLSPGPFPSTNVVASTSCSVMWERTPKSTTAAANTAVAITSEANKPSGVGVQVKVMKSATEVDSSFNGPVKIVKVSGPSDATLGGDTVNAVNGIADWGNATSGTALTLNKLGKYELQATAGSLTPSAKTALIVSEFTLDCTTDPPPETIPASAMFDASVNATQIGETDWAAGYRGPDTKGNCPKVNYLTTNNITGPSGTADANGLILPSNAFSITYDMPATPSDVVLAYTLTFKPELTDSTGVPETAGRAIYCVSVADNDCRPSTDPDTPNPNRKLMMGCASPAVALTSLPKVNGVREPVCLAGVSWTTLPASACSPAPTGTEACVQATIRVIDGKDPPIIWGGLN